MSAIHNDTNNDANNDANNDENNDENNAELEAALKRCASEQIQFASATQPHGVLLGIDDAGMLRMCSNNLETIFNRRAADALERPATELIGAEAIWRLRTRLLKSNHPGHIVALNLNPTSTGLTLNYHATAHQSGPLMVIELCAEIVDEYDATDDMFALIKDNLDKMNRHTEVDGYFQYIATELQRITQFDRVKVYRFDSRWNGAVIAESRNDALPALLGHHFPASDIPPQARALYAKNLMRILVDTEAATVPIMPAQNPLTSQALDLSHSSLRAISPIHIEYVRNMGVRSTITVSLMHENKLWGLVACHNTRPQRFAPRLIEALSLIGKLMTQNLSALENSTRLKAMDEARQHLNRLTEIVRSAPNIHTAFQNFSDDFLTLTGATGSHIVSENGNFTIGKAPDQAALLALLEWVRQQPFTDGVFMTDSLGSCYWPAQAFAKLVSGLLVVELDPGKNSFILWFRPETMRTTPWAGSPHKQIVTDAIGPRIDPRRSFEAWIETASGFSEPWPDSSIDAAKLFSLALVQLLMQQIHQQAAIDAAANQTRIEFVSTVSHELRTPLTSISGSLGLVMGGALGEVPARIMGVLEIANRNSLRLTHLINDLLDMEKLVAGKMHLKLQIQPLLPQIMQALESIRDYGEKFNVRFKLTEPAKSVEQTEQADAVLVNIDDGRLQQVLLNLMSNAAKFSPTGGEVQVRMKVDKENLRVRVEVTDHGAGIPQEFRGRIFQKFSQAETANSRKNGGTGLGLAISQELVERMGGSLGFESAEGQGSTFHLELPIPVPVPMPMSQSSPSPKPPVPRILVVDDEPDIAHLLELMLIRGGYAVDCANNGQQALQALTQTHYDAMTLDLMLSDMTGLTLLQKIRQMPNLQNLPVIVVSHQLGQGKMAVEGEFAYVNWLSKPINHEQLLEMVKRSLPSRATRHPRVLHVEDDTDLHHVVRAMVGEEFDFELATSLAHARLRLTNEQFDVILLDLGLPDGLGPDLIPMVRALQPGARVVVLSGIEMAPEEIAKVEAALVKSRVSSDNLIEAIKAGIGSTFK